MSSAREFAEQLDDAVARSTKRIVETIAPLIESRDAALLRDERAPMECGHPKACWVGVLNMDEPFTVDTPITKGHCTACAELANAKENEDAAIMAANSLGDELRRVKGELARERARADQADFQMQSLIETRNELIEAAVARELARLDEVRAYTKSLSSLPSCEGIVERLEAILDRKEST